MEDLFDAAGSLRELYAGVDWAATSLGPVTSWSPTLTAALRMTFQTRFPVALFGGPDHVMLYNEAYVRMIADKHPAALGTPTHLVFPEIWETIGPMLGAATGGLGGTWVQDMRLMINRHGFLEETYFTFSYSALIGAEGQVDGVIEIAAETTAQVLADRRLRFLHRLNERLADVEQRGELLDRALPMLRGATDDLAGVTLLIPTSDEEFLPVGETGAQVDTVTLAKDDTGTTAHVRLADPAGGGDYGVLIVQLSPHLMVEDAYLSFIRLIGSTLTQTLDRIQRRRADRLLASMQRAMSEALQETLLTLPAQPSGPRVAVRYRSSIAQSHIGGDWYDAFTLPGGALTVAVGDVSGHDLRAATAMAQLRNLLRGIAYTVGTSPSQILTHLNGAMLGLPVDAYATVVLAQIEPGTRMLRWSNAGHPPPALLLPDGTAGLLEASAETLLGTRTAVLRTDHAVTLDPGATVVLYTDGLIERRHADLDDGLGHLLRTLAGRQHLDAEQICDHLLAEFAPTAEDDIALAVIRVS